MRQTAGVDEHGNVEEQLLRPLKREYRDDEIAATRQRSLDFGFQERTPLLDRQILAGPVAISAFADHMVKPRRSFGIGVKGLVIRAKVAGKEQARFANLHLDGSRSENVAGIPQPGREAPRGLEPLVQRDRLDLTLGRLGIGLGIDRLDRLRSDERRVGKEGVSTCRSRGAPDHTKKKN